MNPKDIENFMSKFLNENDEQFEKAFMDMSAYGTSLLSVEIDDTGKLSLKVISPEEYIDEI